MSSIRRSVLRGQSCRIEIAPKWAISISTYHSLWYCASGHGLSGYFLASRMRADMEVRPYTCKTDEKVKLRADVEIRPYT